MPQRPTDVVLARASGERVPLELAYAGRDGDGIDVWKIATRIDFAAGDHLCVGVFPARCSIEFPTTEGVR